MTGGGVTHPDGEARERALAEARQIRYWLAQGSQSALANIAADLPELLETLAACETARQTAERERLDLIGLVQRWQPAGSPPPGGVEVTVRWIMQSLQQRAETAEQRAEEAERRYRVLFLDRECERARAVLSARPTEDTPQANYDDRVPDQSV